MRVSCAYSIEPRATNPHKAASSPLVRFASARLRPWIPRQSDGSVSGDRHTAQSSACQTLYRSKTDKTQQCGLRRLRKHRWLRVDAGGRVWPGVIAGPDDGVI